MNQDFFIRLAADGTMLPIIIIGAYALIFKVSNKDRLEVYSRIIVAGLSTYLFAKLLGSIYQPEILRPFEIVGTHAGASFLNNPGFPSDHMLFATAITCAVWFETRQKLFTWILIALVITVGIGRVLALVHTPLDVLGGILIALLGSLWYLNPRSKIKL